MATSGEQEFSSWLLMKLNQAKVDEHVFHDYILSVLRDEETLDEKLEILKSVLGGDNALSENEINLYCEEILEKWQQSLFSATVPEPTKMFIENVDQKLARLLESNVRVEETASISTYTDDELRIREAILSRYSQADESDNDTDNNCDQREPDDIVKNTNASLIHQAEKEKREKAKLENQKKKEKDKQDREKQKLTQQEKKEARRKRAQKVEHHRK